MTNESVNVVTAGPSAGKSSTIRDLSSRGYRTLPESARILFDQRISEGDDPEDVRKEDDFHEQVEKIDRRIEQHIPDNESVFLDRSLADNLAYRKHFSSGDGGFVQRNDPEYREIQNEVIGRYDNVFVLERIQFEDDEVRSEDEDEAQKLHELLKGEYEKLDCDIYEVPVIPVDERTEYILERAEIPE